MARRATPDEERLHSGERVVMDQELAVAALPMVTLRVIYLGGHPHKTVRLKGTIDVQTIGDPDDPDRKHEIRRQVKEGYTVYDFSNVDSLGRPMRERVTAEGRRYEECSHLGHLKAFYEFRDAEKAKQFELRGSAQAVAVVKKFIEQTRQHRNADSGAAVLEEMEF